MHDEYVNSAKARIEASRERTRDELGTALAQRDLEEAKTYALLSIAESLNSVISGSHARAQEDEIEFWMNKFPDQVQQWSGRYEHRK